MILRIVRTEILVETWVAELPTVDAVRPQQCPCCGGRHHQDGCAIHGHGKRERALWGPTEVDGEPTTRLVVVRRFRCVTCRSILIVTPAEVGPYVSFSLPAILAALAAWGLDGVTAGSLLPALSPSPRRGNSDPWRWPSIRRWLARRGVLFPQVDISSYASLRETAAALAAAMVARLSPAPAYATPSAAWRSALGP